MDAELNELRATPERLRSLAAAGHLPPGALLRAPFLDGAESFFLQEGHAKHYSGAKYGELRVAASGDSVLAGLRDKDLERLGPGKK